MDIEKKYYLRELTITVNQRSLFYDYDLHRAIYTYKCINKAEFKIDFKKWNKICKKYKLWKDYSFSKYEEIRNDYSRN